VRSVEEILKPIIEKIHLVLDSPDIPKAAKERFVRKTGVAIDELSSYTPDDIKSFMSRQKSIAQGFLPDDINYFLTKVIANQIENEFAFIPGLIQSYKEPRITSPTGQTFQQENL
jgi:hypothetical protein